MSIGRIWGGLRDWVGWAADASRDDDGVAVFARDALLGGEGRVVGGEGADANGLGVAGGVDEELGVHALFFELVGGDPGGGGVLEGGDLDPEGLGALVVAGALG